MRLPPSIERLKLKTFRTIKYRSLTKQSPAGRFYIFVRDKDISAVKNGQYFPEDEAWMMELTSGIKPLLVWTNMPEEIANTIQTPSNKVMLSDTFGYQPKEDVTRHIFGRSDSEIQAELELARLEERRELENRPVVEYEPSELENLMEEYEALAEMYLSTTLELDSSVERIAFLESELEKYEIRIVEESVCSEDEVIVTPEIEEEPKAVDSENLLKLKEALAETSSVDMFIRDMKPEFKVEDLEEVAEELGMEYEGKKADMLRKFVEKLAE